MTLTNVNYKNTHNFATGQSFITGVTILLSLTVFLNLVAESMPATSDAVPLIGKSSRSLRL